MTDPLALIHPSERLTKDSPAVGDVHVSTTGGARRQRKAPISPDTKLPVTGATMAAQAENPDDDASPLGKLNALFQKVRDADADADAKVTAALTQIMHDCSCAMGAQCADNALGDGKGSKTAKRDDTAGGDEAWAIPFKIAKADPDQQLIFGWASVSEEGGRLLVDKQGDSILPEDLEKAAYDFVLHARQHGEMHKIIGTGKLVESMMFTTEKQAALGINVGKVGWWVGFRVSDPDTWAAHKRGELPEFSIGGSGRRVEA